VIFDTEENAFQIWNQLCKIYFCDIYISAMHLEIRHMKTERTMSSAISYLHKMRQELNDMLQPSYY